MHEDEDELDDAGYRCERCGEDQRTLRAGSLDDALASARVCFAADGRRIDRAHVEAVHDLLGEFALPLDSRIAARAKSVRPELDHFEVLVSAPDATLVHPAENHSRRLERLLELRAPDVVVDQARDSLARAADREIHLEWERVHGWPAPMRYTGTVAFGIIARLVASQVFETLVATEAERLLALLDGAIANLRLDDEGLVARKQLVAEVARAETVGDLRRRLGLTFAIRCLDELGHTGLRDNQDTLVDDAASTLLHARRDADARGVFTMWLEIAVPAAREAIAAPQST